MNNFELLNFAIKNNHDLMFGCSVDIDKKFIFDVELDSLVISLLHSDFLNKSYLGAISNIEVIKNQRDVISDKWCKTYNRSEIAHYDFLLSIIDFFNGNKRKLIDIIFHISNIYATFMIGEISKPTTEIKLSFHRYNLDFRSQIAKGFGLEVAA